MISEVPLPELLVTIVDNRGRTCPTSEHGFPLIATNCVRRDQLYPSFDNVRYIDDNTYKTWFRGHPKADDIVFVCKGDPGRTALVPDPVPFAIAQDMVALRPDRAKVAGRYLFYALRSRKVQERIANMHVGTMIPHFKKGDFGKLLIPVHNDLTEQQAIAEVLGALDDKIAANTALGERADELMHQTFRSLVKTSEAPLSTVANFVNGKAFTKGASGTGRVVVRIAELNGGIGGSTVYSDAAVDDKHVARPGDILFAWSGSLTLHRWFREEAIVNQHIFKVIPHDQYPAWLVYELIRLKLADFKAIAADKATTMGHIQRHHLDELVGLPTTANLNRLGPLMSALWSASLTAERESLTLIATRDALLPQLMSGKLRVRDAERIAAEAGA